MATEKYLNALERVLSERYLKSEYKIGGYQESSVCMETSDNSWIVYNGERGNRYNVVDCDTVLRACLGVMRKLAKDKTNIEVMEDELLQLIVNAA